VVTRKNAHDSHNDDAARLATRIWTFTATAEMAGLNILTCLIAYLDACGHDCGKPLTGTGTIPLLGPQNPPTCAFGATVPARLHLAPVTTAALKPGIEPTPSSAYRLTRFPSTYVSGAGPP
jgi:hypothetical protein